MCFTTVFLVKQELLPSCYVPRHDILNDFNNHNGLTLTESSLCVKNYFKHCICSDPFSLHNNVSQMMRLKHRGVELLGKVNQRMVTGSGPRQSGSSSTPLSTMLASWEQGKKITCHIMVYKPEHIKPRG